MVPVACAPFAGRYYSIHKLRIGIARFSSRMTTHSKVSLAEPSLQSVWQFDTSGAQAIDVGAKTGFGGAVPMAGKRRMADRITLHRCGAARFE